MRNKRGDIYLCATSAAVQNERQPRNTATIRPETLKDMDPETIIREASVAVGAFGCGPATLRFGGRLLARVLVTFDGQFVKLAKLTNSLHQKWPS